MSSADIGDCSRHRNIENARNLKPSRSAPRADYAGTGLSHTDGAYEAIFGREGETPEERAFRRFPITAHKPGGR